MKKGASGNDFIIGNEMIKTIAPTILPLFDVFNAILKSQNYSESWCNRITSPIHKNGEDCQRDNYKGIAINSCLSKAFNLLLTTRLTNFTDVKEAFKYNQVGFRKVFQTADYDFTTKIVIDKYIREN